MNFQIRRLYHDQQGQAIYLVAGLLVVFLGMAALSIDIGYALHGERELQASADAAATAGAVDLTTTLNETAAGAQKVAVAYSGQSGQKNAIKDLTSVKATATAKCLTTIGLCAGVCPCAGVPSGDNAMAVTETATAPTFFAKLFGISSINLTAQALSTIKGTGVPFNIVVILDSTQSMQTHDSSCKSSSLPNPTKEDCAKAGVQTLLSELSPCSSTLQSCGSATNGNVQNPVQEVALLTFPGIQTADEQYEYDCQATVVCSTTPGFCPVHNCGQTGSNCIFGLEPYTNTTNYTVVGFSSDYKSSDSATSLNGGSSPLVDTVSWQNQSGCSNSKYGLQDNGGEDTYYADVIQTAQNMFPTSGSRGNMQNAIILLSDGDAQAQPPLISSSLSSGECARGVKYANEAASAGTWVYTIGYGASSGRGTCYTDGGAYSGCSAMEAMAGSPGNIPDLTKFYSDNSTGNCQSPDHPSITSLTDIFGAIGSEMQRTRLIPFNTQ